MTVRVLRGGAQTTLQAAPRTGLRHLGIPSSGPADGLSMALANRLVGNAALAPALEITLYGPRLRFDLDACFALVGAPVDATLNGDAIAPHESLRARSGDVLDIGSMATGARCYLAVEGGIAGSAAFGSVSTYLPAGLGGIEGRALREGDALALADPAATTEGTRTPPGLRVAIPTNPALRCCDGPDAGLLDAGLRERLYGGRWRAGLRADRMGIELAGERLLLPSGGQMASAPVFPGSLQCPEGGTPYLLSVDAQTTGGYPQVLQVARCDRHLVGQLRPGGPLRFLARTAGQAAADLRDKLAYFRDWVPDVDDAL